MSLNERAGLFPVLLLTGCTQHAVITGPPSGSVVDSMLLRSAADISAMQYRIHQSTPSAQRPASSASRPAGTALTGSSVTSQPLLKTGVAKNSPGLTGAGPAGGFIAQNGAEPTLRAALKKIVPSGTRINFDPAVRPDTPELWSWTGNDRWQYVADKMLASRSLKATLNTMDNILTVEPVQRAQAVHSALAAASQKPAATKIAAPGTVTATPVPTSGRNPFRGNMPAKDLAAVAASPVITARPKPVIRVWKIERGASLRQGFEQWASQEACPPGRPRWSVKWDTATDYPIDVTLTFNASSFEDATTQLFSLWHRAQVPLFVSGYRPQCLIVVSDVPPGLSSPHPQQD